jgi:hypothetical protein
MHYHSEMFTCRWLVSGTLERSICFFLSLSEHGRYLSTFCAAIDWVIFAIEAYLAHGYGNWKVQDQRTAFGEGVFIASTHAEGTGI